MPFASLKNTTILFCIFLLLSGPISYAKPPNNPEIITNYSYPENSTDLESFLSKELGVPNDVLKNQGYLEKIKKWNPHIENSSALQQGEEVYIELPYGTPIQNRRPSQRHAQTPLPKLSAPSHKKDSPIQSRSQTLLASPKVDSSYRQRFHLKAMYMISTGIFSQSTLNGEVSADTQQNSPITLGLSGSYQMADNLQLRAHTSLAKLNGVSSEVEIESSIPWQYEVSLSARYSREEWAVAPIFGIEIEKLSTFNILELSSGAIQILDTQEDNLFLGTLGAEYITSMLDYTINLTPSLSRVISSSNFTGTRLQVQLQAQAPSSAWSYHLLIRHYLMNAPKQELKLTRFGVGLSFQFF